MPPQPGSPGRPGQAYTALGSFGRALGAQSRFMPQTATMGRRAARGGAAQEEQLAQNYQRWLDKVRRQERLSFYAGLARMSHEGVLGIVEGRERAEQAQRIEQAMAVGRLGPQPGAGVPSGPGLPPPPPPPPIPSPMGSPYATMLQAARAEPMRLPPEEQLYLPPEWR